MSTRVQVILDEQEREIFRWHALREGLSLSAWLRKAAQDKIAGMRVHPIKTAQELERFFADCDAREQNLGDEPEWEEHLQLLSHSRTMGLPRP